MRTTCERWGRALAIATLLGGWIPLPAVAQAAGSGTSASPEAPRSLPKDLPLRRDEPGQVEGPPWIALFVLLVIGAGAAVLVVRRRGAPALLRAWQRAPAGTAIERLASQPLTPQVSVHAVRWQGEELLLGCTGTHVRVLARRPVPDDGREA